MSGKNWFKSAAARWARGISIRRRIPLVAWLPSYSASLLVRDALAGLTVALMAVPQGIAYGQLAGLPPHFGLYACLLSGLCYALLGTTDAVSIGPTAVMSLLTAEFAAGDVQRSVFLAFFTGVVVTVAGCCRLGFLVDFFSVPVVSGFVSAASITICSTQFKGLFGVKGSSGKTMTATLRHVLLHIKETKLWDLLLGVSSIVILLCLRKLGQLRQRKEEAAKLTRRSRLLVGSLWLLSIARNAVVVLLASVLVLVLEHHHLHPFSTTGTVAVGFPTLQLPPFSGLARNITTTAANGTATAEHGGWRGVPELTSELGIGLLIVPLVSVIECMAIAKAFASHSRPQDPSQEMIALGVCNLLGALFSSYTVTGSFSRTALNHASGAATPLAGVITCLLVMVALGSLTPSFRYIPTAALSAVIICAVIFMVDWRIVLDLWRCRKPDLIPLLVTFLVGLFWRLEYGILLGTGVSLLLLLHRAARPKVTLTYRLTPAGRRPYLLVLPDCGLNYPAAEHVRELIQEAAWTTAAPSEYEMAATSIVQAAPPSAGDSSDEMIRVRSESSSESDDAKEEEIDGLSNGVNVPTSNRITGNFPVGVSKDEEATIPFVDDIITDEESAKQSNGYHLSKSPQQKRVSLMTNGSCGDACQLNLTSEDNVLIRKDIGSNELRNRRFNTQCGSARKKDAPLPVMLNCRNIRFTDYTAAKSLAAAANSLQQEGGSPLLLLEIKPSVLAVWSGADPGAFVVSQSEAAAAQLVDERGEASGSDDCECVTSDGKDQNASNGYGANGKGADGTGVTGPV